jgi:hypothetical protein
MDFPYSKNAQAVSGSAFVLEFVEAVGLEKFRHTSGRHDRDRERPHQRTRVPRGGGGGTCRRCRQERAPLQDPAPAAAARHAQRTGKAAAARAER